MAYHRVNKNETTCKSDYLKVKKKHTNNANILKYVRICYLVI